MNTHRNFLHTVSVPVLSTLIIGTSAALYVPSSSGVMSGMAIRSDQVALVATIDTSSSAVGIAESSLIYMDQADLNTAMSQLQSMGVTQVRVLMPWENIEFTQGTYNWTQADQLMNTAAKYNIAVDATITSTPPWASQYSNGGWPPDAAPDPSAYQAYAQFAATVATRYAKELGSIEVFNEPNGANGWYPSPNAAGYTQLLKDAYTAIKAANPNITVVGGVLGAGQTIGSLTVNPVDFLKQMYADGAAGYFDALAYHPYNDTGNFSNGAYYANSALDQLKQMQALMAANGDAAKQVWATEYGESSADAGGQAQQAAFIQDFLNTWSQQKGVGPMFIYSLIDDNENDNMGLLADDYTPKQALAVVEAWLKAHPTTNTDPADPPAAADPPSNPVTAAMSAMQQMAANMATAMADLAKTFSSNIATAMANMSKMVANVAAALKSAMTGTTAPATTSATSTTAATSATAASLAAATSPATAADAVSATTAKPATAAKAAATAADPGSAATSVASKAKAPATATPKVAAATDATADATEDTPKAATATATKPAAADSTTAASATTKSDDSTTNAAGGKQDSTSPSKSTSAATSNGGQSAKADSTAGTTAKKTATKTSSSAGAASSGSSKSASKPSTHKTSSGNNHHGH